MTTPPSNCTAIIDVFREASARFQQEIGDTDTKVDLAGLEAVHIDVVHGGKFREGREDGGWMLRRTG